MEIKCRDENVERSCKKYIIVILFIVMQKKVVLMILIKTNEQIISLLFLKI